MSRQDAINTILKVESAFDVNSLISDTLCVWPILRYHIAASFQHNIVGIPDNEAVYDPIKTLDYAEKHIDDLRRLQRVVEKSDYLSQTADAAFLVNSAYREKDLESGRWLHRFFDSLLSYFPDDFKVVGLEYSDNAANSPSLNKGVYTTTSINEVLKLTQLENCLNIFSSNLTGSSEYTIDNLGHFFRFLKDNAIPLNISQLNFNRELATIRRLANKLIGIFSTLKIKKVFIVRSYGLMEMAAILAAKHLFIEVIELQHGQQGESHPAYTNWSTIPREGYTLLPDTYWQWSQTSVKRIQTWASDTSHRAVAIGSPWLSAWKHGVFISDKTTKHKATKESSKKKVLVAFQPINISWFFEQLDSIMKICGEDIDWLIRLHPSHPEMIKNKDLIKTKLSSLSVKCEWELPTSRPLYSLLPEIDIVLSQFSTVVYEGLAFDKPAVLILRFPEDFKHDFINDGVTKCKNAEQASRALLNSGKSTGNSSIDIVSTSQIRKVLLKN